MTNLESILKSRDTTLPTKVQTCFFHVVMCGCESCTIKKAEHQRIDAFELWCWRRLLIVSWTARRPNQSILKEINSIFTGRTDAEKSLILGKTEGKMKRVWPRMRCLGSITNFMNMNLSKL